MDAILKWDDDIFHFINPPYARPYLDEVMKFFSGPWIWVIFVAIYAVVLWKRRDNKTIRFGIFCLISLFVADTACYRILKPNVERIRPCLRANFERRLVLDACGGAYSFPSNHSANAMSLASLTAIYAPAAALPAVLVALVIGYSRIYVGVHYPIDVLVGFLIGIFATALVCRIGARLSIRKKT